ncbi:MAG: hypothetical protein E6K22_00165 [Gammaproteobacteria bacterium]|nr:MAG: hypothetical protein E6K22_00165 [Gammaproteobacteria bacterium]
MASMGTAAGGSAVDASMKSAGPGRSMETEIAALEARLARDGGTSDDWNLLAKAYEFLGRPDDAARARSHIAKPAVGATVSQLSAGALVAAATATETRTSAARPSPPAPAPSLAEVETRVKKNPNDVQAWLALADLRRTEHDDRGARDALAKVIELHGMTAQSWADYADVLASLSGGSLAGEAGRAIDSALALDPANLKAVWLKASAAHEQRHFTDALGWPRRVLRGRQTPQALRAVRKCPARSRSTAVWPAASSATRLSLSTPRRRTRPARRSRCCGPRRARGP